VSLFFNYGVRAQLYAVPFALIFECSLLATFSNIQKVNDRVFKGMSFDVCVVRTTLYTQVDEHAFIFIYLADCTPIYL